VDAIKTNTILKGSDVKTIDFFHKMVNGSFSWKNLYLISPYDYKGRLVVQELETIFERTIEEYLYDN
jgi:hypothetical protein